MPTEMPRRSQSVFSDSDVPSKVTVLTPIHLAMSECYGNIMRSKPSWNIDCSWHILVVKTTKHKHHCLDKKQALHPNHLHRCISTELASDETREVPSSKYLVGNAHNSPTKDAMSCIINQIQKGSTTYKLFLYFSAVDKCSAWVFARGDCCVDAAHVWLQSILPANWIPKAFWNTPFRVCSSKHRSDNAGKDM